MEFTKEHNDQQSRQTEMIRLCKNLFWSIDCHGISPEIRNGVVKDMECWNLRCYEEISCDQLAEFIAQAVEGVFGKSINSATKQSPCIDTPQNQ